MKQVLQSARTGKLEVVEVPAPRVLPGCVLVRIAASLVSAGTERASAEFASKNLLQKARSRPDLVRDVFKKIQRDGLLTAVSAVRSRLDQPTAPGYSSAGVVVEIGEGISDLKPGDRVVEAVGLVQIGHVLGTLAEGRNLHVGIEAELLAHGDGDVRQR